MQHQEGPSNGLGNSTSSRLPYTPVKSSSQFGDHTGFSHGAYNSNHLSLGGYADRHPRRANITSISTGPLSQGTPQNANDMTSPATAFDMQFTPLLPSQLLLGSPFQPGSPSTFASPQFSSFSNFQHQSGPNQHQNQQNHMASPLQGQQNNLSPQVYQSLISPTGGFGGTQFYGGPQSPTGGFASLGHQALGGMASPVQMAPGMISGTSRTVYLGNIPPETSAEEILSHVRSGQIESVRLLPDKNCAFISFLDGSSATHFHSDAILKKLSIRGQDIKVGWGKPSQVPTSVALAVQQSGASRNVYLGNLSEDVTEMELREDLGKFGPIDTIKLVREKAIGFVHFLSIGNAVKAVSQLPQEGKWQAPRRVYYGKDRCAYVSKTQQQNAAQYLGIAPGYAHVLNGADRDLISNALAQQSVAAAAVATTAGGVNNLGNRTVYLGNIHPETTIEEICNVIRGGLLHHIRYIPDKHICFVTFIDPTSAASFYALSNLQGLMIHNRRLKIGWGKHSGALPPAIALAVSGGASRNVYIGNLDESWTEERLRQDFSEYGEIELVNALREKSCAFVNFTNIANAIKAIEAVRGREEYRRFKINFGKDRCGNAPRQVSNNNNQQQQNQQQQHSGSPTGHDGAMGSPSPMSGGFQPSFSQSESSPTRSGLSPAPGSTGATSINGQQLHSNQQQHHFQQPQHAQTPSAILNAGNNNPLTMYLNQVSTQQQQQQQQSQPQVSQSHDPFSVASLQQQQQSVLAAQQAAIYGTSSGDLAPSTQAISSAFEPQRHQTQQQQSSFSSHDRNSSLNIMAFHNPAVSSGATTIGGLLAPTNTGIGASRSQHARAISLPVFSQGPFGQQQSHQQPLQTSQQNGFVGLGTGFGGFGSGSGFGLAIQSRDGGLNGWAEEEIGSQ
ncbi:MAG: hypothetical protein M1827_006772 [Pycnora praestabilis]|nr:MAG: hypothetical protein M1827_006772 [Pycnora praestabilis]